MVVAVKDRYNMEYELHDLKAEDYEYLKEYFEKRTPGTCDTMFIDNYMWKDYYNAKYFITDKGLFWILNMRGVYFTILPMCLEKDLQECFELIVKYFREVLKAKFIIYIADEAGINTLSIDETKFEVKENRDYFDYVYDANKLRTLSGKKLHKKKNHLNYFLKNYENRFKYKRLQCSDREEILEFLDFWYKNKNSDDIYRRLDDEYKGIIQVLDNCKHLDYKMGAICIDEKIQAFTLGSYSKSNDMVFIHIEKANPNIRGLYNTINQMFLINEYPDVSLVNREDDMGLSGLRAAKMSYRPLYLSKKYSVIEK